jgi:hypothetical protein
MSLPGDIPHFLLLLCDRFVALIEVFSESCYRVVRLLLGSVDCHTHGLGLTSEGQQASTEEESDRSRVINKSAD